MPKQAAPPAPSRHAEWVLGHLLKDEVWHTPLGDFAEVYASVAREKGTARAALWYWGQILRLLPPKTINTLYWRMNMLKNDLKMAIRSIKRNKGYSLINVTGLAVGIASCLLILLFVQHEFSYDRFHEKADRICRIGLTANLGTNSFSVADGPAPLAEAILSELPEVARATRIFRIRRVFIRYEDKQFREENWFYADPNVFEVLTLPLIAGDPKTVLEQPDSVVITPKVAEKYFGSTDVLGKVLRAENDRSFKVTGLVREMPVNSHFHYDFLASSLGYPPSQATDWVSNGTFTYLVLNEGATVAQLESKLPQFAQKHFEPVIKEGFGVPFEKFLESGNYLGFTATPLLDIHLHSQLGNELESTGNHSTVLIFAAIAVVILLVACINFTNLATARASKRANEVGIRKVVGSQRRQLIQQFLTESLFLSTVAFAIALGLTRLALPVFNKIMDKEISLAFLGNWYVIPFLAGFAVFIGVLAGGYPAFMLASFRPVSVLKGKVQSGKRERRFRNALVVFQFFATVVLFVGTIVIASQLHYMQTKDLGLEKDQVVVIQNAHALGGRQEAFKTELKRNPDVLDAAYSTGGPFMSLSAQVFRKEGGQDATTNYTLVNITADHDFMNTFRMEMMEGRFFSRENSTDGSAIVLNEAAVRAMGIEDPVGKELMELNDEGTSYTIIGTIRNFHMQSLQEAIRPLVLTLKQEGPVQFLSIRIRPEQVERTLEFIEDRWAAFETAQPVDYVFLDERFERQFQADSQTGNVFSAFAALAIFIACLGLFGLASFMAEQKTKEIGIRKVLGASAGGIVVLLSKEYVKWLAMANLLAWPLAYYAMFRWLQRFAFRTTLGVWPFLLAGGAALTIALLTVSYQSIKAALTHPIKSLRYE